MKKINAQQLDFLEKPVQAFHPKARQYFMAFMKYRQLILFAMGVSIGLFCLIVVSQASFFDPLDWTSKILASGGFGACVWKGATLFLEDKTLRLGLEFKGKTYDCFSKKSFLDRYLSAPIDDLKSFLTNHSHGGYFLKTPPLRKALEQWLIHSEHIGTYEIARLEMALEYYHQNVYLGFLMMDSTPYVEDLWGTFQRNIDQQRLQNATPTTSLKIQTRRL